MAGIVGFNFTDQVVASLEMASVFRALFTDGRFHGCNLTFSGSQLTVGTGRMMIGGYLFRITSDQVLTAPSGYSGEGVLVAQIDLTQTSSSTVFDQVSLALRKSTDPIQSDDLDNNGTVYEAVIGRVTISNGSITEIVSQIPSARRAIYELPTTPDSSVGKDGDICIIL